MHAHGVYIEGEEGIDPLGPGLLAFGLGSLEVEPDDQRLLEKESFLYDAVVHVVQDANRAIE